VQLPANDALYMRIALDLGLSVANATGDNPAVGCVIVRDRVVVGRGATQPPGGAHAEVMAIRDAERAGHSIAACELFVTLEPCAFHGRTPPCSTLIVAKRPRRVVIGTIDPHPRVRGRGLAELRGADIEVVLGVLGNDVRQNLGAWLARFDPIPPTCGE
jgi:diaminohydroxyphosphoribosylaminopyrimidine deaminase/5-amino-6-(5-phosphoribosylamino)uracil reductase